MQNADGHKLPEFRRNTRMQLHFAETTTTGHHRKRIRGQQSASYTTNPTASNNSNRRTQVLSPLLQQNIADGTIKNIYIPFSFRQQTLRRSGGWVVLYQTLPLEPPVDWAAPDWSQPLLWLARRHHIARQEEVSGDRQRHRSQDGGRACKQREPAFALLICVSFKCHLFGALDLVEE